MNERRANRRLRVVLNDGSALAHGHELTIAQQDSAITTLTDMLTAARSALETIRDLEQPFSLVTRALALEGLEMSE